MMSKQGFETLYTKLKIAKMALKDVTESYPELSHDFLKEKIIDIKRDIRRAYRTERWKLTRRYFEGYDESGESSFEYFDKFFENAEEAQEWARETYDSGQIYADYSPTGKWFVSSVKTAHLVGDIWRCRISYSLDV